MAGRVRSLLGDSHSTSDQFSNHLVICFPFLPHPLYSSLSRARARASMYFSEKILHIFHISANTDIYNVLDCERKVKDVKEMAKM